jgi:Anthrone oxygenase
MLHASEFVATFCAPLFAGAALYITVVEHPSRMSLETGIAAAQWAPSYRHATWLQAPLALVSFLAGVTAWLLGAGIGWLVAALVIGSVVPFTLIAIRPTNHKLLMPGRDLSSAETRLLLERWGRLHMVRTTLSLVGSGIYIWSALGA